MEYVDKRKKDAARLAVSGGAGAGVVQQSGLRAGLRGRSLADQQAMLQPAQAQAPVQAKGDTTVMQDIALGQDINDRERAILEKDAEAASAWVQAASWAVGIASTYSHTRPDSDKSMYGGRADALRHFLWNAYMAFLIGPKRAEALANAHELAEEPASNNPAVDRQMDLRNNARGRQLGAWHRKQGAITRAFALSLMAAAGIAFVNDGSLSVIDKSDPNNWRLVPSNTKGID